MAKPERQDLDAAFWTLDQAARHFGFGRAAIRKYVREGLPTYFQGQMVKPAEIVAERLRRRAARHAGRPKRR